MNWFDRIVLLATGLVAVYLVFRLFQDYKKNNKACHDIYYIISFVVLFVSGVLLIIFSYDILPRPCVIIVTTLLPMGIATGLVTEFHKKYGKAYLIFAIVGLIAIAATRFTDAGALATVSLAFFHSIAGLTIVAVPYLAVRNKLVPGGFIFVSVGGILIGLGGIALAFLKSGGQLLFFSQEFVMAILAPLLLLMTLAYTWGFVKKILAEKE